MIARTGVKCRSCKMPVVLPLRSDLPSPPFCGCRFYRKRVRNVVIELPKIRIRVESPLWLVQRDHGNEFALLGEGLEILVEHKSVRFNGEPIRGAKLVLPPT